MSVNVLHELLFSDFTLTESSIFHRLVDSKLPIIFTFVKEEMWESSLSNPPPPNYQFLQLITVSIKVRVKPVEYDMSVSLGALRIKLHSLHGHVTGSQKCGRLCSF
jgi:hypothetical protein